MSESHINIVPYSQELYCVSCRPTETMSLLVWAYCIPKLWVAIKELVNNNYCLCLSSSHSIAPLSEDSAFIGHGTIIRLAITVRVGRRTHQPQHSRMPGPLARARRPHHRRRDTTPAAHKDLWSTSMSTRTHHRHIPVPWKTSTSTPWPHTFVIGCQGHQR